MAPVNAEEGDSPGTPKEGREKRGGNSTVAANEKTRFYQANAMFSVCGGYCFITGSEGIHLLSLSGNLWVT